MKLTISCSGRAGHGSIPRNADNALVRAAEVVTHLHAYSTPSGASTQCVLYAFKRCYCMLLLAVLLSRVFTADSTWF
jgi:Peptidase dimerisation domain